MVPTLTSDRPAPSARRRPGAGTRRRVLGAAGAAALTALAGCSGASPFETEESPEYSLAIERIDESPSEYALYEPSEGADERELLSAILPEGRHTTYGYRPVPDEAYVDRGGTYYGVEYAVTGRKRVERPLVRLDPVAEADVPGDAVAIDDLDEPSRSILGLLSLHVDDTGGFSADELRGDARVLRRPEELDGRLATGDLDGRVVTRNGPGNAYRVRVTRERIVETAYTAFAVEVADSRAAFREVVLGARVDAELAPADLPADARRLLDEAIAAGTYAETAPLSDRYDDLLAALGLGDVDTAVNGRLLLYDSDLYRYGLYVD